MIVLDASAVLELILNTERGAAVRRRIASPGVSLHSPHLVDLEIAQVLRRLTRSAAIDESRAAQALLSLVGLDVSRHRHDDLLPRIWALRDNLTAYDACYVALAEALEAPLVTFDERIARCPGLATEIEHPGN